MEHQKILNLFNKNFKFVTRKWHIVNYYSITIHDVAREIIYNTQALKFNLCD